MADTAHQTPRAAGTRGRLIAGLVVVALLVGGGWYVMQQRTPAAPPATAGPPGRGPWMPLHVGAAWEYDRQIQRIIQMEGQLDRNNTNPGFLRVRVGQPTRQYRGRGPAFAVDSQQVEKAHGGSSAFEDHVTVFAQDGSGLYSQATWIPPLEKDTKVLEYHPPLQWLRFPVQVGAKWTVGEYDDEGNHVAITGEVLGFEEVSTLAGKFSACLKVRYLKTTKGTVLIQQRKVTPSLDLEEMIWWYASGVGPVRQVNTVTRELVTPLGKHLNSVFTASLVLKSFKENSPPLPSESKLTEELAGEGRHPEDAPVQPAPSPRGGKGP